MNGQTEKYLTDFAVTNDIRLDGIMRMADYKNEYGRFILNLDYKGMGTHWVGLVHSLDDKLNEVYYYFDSFGFKPPAIFASNHKPIFYSNVDFQALNSSECGIWCIIFLKLMNLFHKPSLENFNHTIEYMKDVEIVWDNHT